MITGPRRRRLLLNPLLPNGVTISIQKKRNPQKNQGKKIKTNSGKMFGTTQKSNSNLDL